MNTQDEYYLTKLYPFQNGIAEIFRKINTPFYLTGGTVISRCFFNHRYSDDLDFFVNSDQNYSQYRNVAIKALEYYSEKYNFEVMKQSIISEENYTQLNLVRIEQNEKIYLKIDIINDIAPYWGKIDNHDIFGKIDNIWNIFANKLSAIYRFEPKDIADIWIISRNMDFDWKEQFYNAKEKEAGLDVQKLSEIIRNFPVDYIDHIKWIIKVDKNRLIDDLSTISSDILMGNKNSLKYN
jgi:predicted nucleotidyltransferase component of viral defense system